MVFHAYTNYLEAKVKFLEELIDNLMTRFDEGGTIPVFYDYEEWKQLQMKEGKRE